VAGLSGCFIAPGMKMQSSPNSVRYTAENQRITPRFIPIDVALARQMNQFSSVTQDDAYYYHVGAHDVLNIFVWGHPELAAPVGAAPSEAGAASSSPTLAPAGYLVSSDGSIYYPMVGTIRVAGKTVEQIRAQLMYALKKYIRNPQIDVRVSGFRSKKIYVMGEVQKPGLLPMTDSPMSITDAINLAGGLDLKSADPSHIFIIRGDYATPDVYWLNAQSPEALLLGENFRLKGQDVIFVSTAEIARWNRAIEQILPTITSVWMTNSMIYTGIKN